MRHGVRTTALRVGRDRLPVREVHDDQQHGDAGCERQDVVQSRQAKRYEECERRLRPICGRSQRIQTEDRHPCQRPDLLSALFRGGQRPA